MAELRVNGVRLHVVDEGPTGAPPILFLHGLLWAGWMFDPQVEALKGRFRCVRMDFRGQGQSEVTPAGYDIETLTVDALGVIEQLALAPCHVVGLSMGGFIGMRLAARRPELVRTLTVLETSADPEPAINVPKYRAMALVGRYLSMRLVAGRVMPIMFGKSFLADASRAADRARYQQRLMQNHPAGIQRAVEGVIRREPIHGELGRIRCPSMVVVGEEDVATVPATAERIAAAIPGAKLVRIPRAGHTSTLENPEAVTAALSGFLDANAS